MIRTSGKIENYKPISVIGNNLYLICWDLKKYKRKDEGEFCTWMEEMVRFKPSLEYIKNLILGWHNEQIDEKILSGFKWNDMPIWLSSENQFNYKAAYDLAVQTGGANLPVTFKFGTTDESVYHTFTTLEEINGFYLSAMKYINDTLAEGWREKDAIDWEQYKIE
jgi:hypothetical protein